ncbi:PhoX family phosphatase [Oscillatoria sp. FACHB-1407]|uniref:PhoX family protein n=1 Tax=Oscillatoria sp. FACHB-1407 TaxID=2692847 RepID=UPI00168A01F4|nr:PhoX family phosphatase [Oscillatoria sp. FACHB-1407]MBD2459935.1 PhoX family phosphatase [Oscillatoria sp. FACHB-1407]
MPKRLNNWGDSVDPDNDIYNTSDNDSFSDVLNRARLSRRGFLKGSSSFAAASMLGMGLAFLADAVNPEGQVATATSRPNLSFRPISKSIADTLTVPEGYTASVLIATGDPLKSNVTPYKNDGTDNDFDVRVGDHHDGMHYFGLNQPGNGWDPNNSNRALLCVNHEVCEDLGFVHPNGPTDYGTDSTAARPTIEIDKEVAAHGVTVVEIAKQGSTYQVNRNSRYNRRVTAATPCEISGPARRSSMMATAFSPRGEQTRGTLNNCAHGYTPWGTYLTCEENWAGYFHRREEDTARTAKEVASFKRYGVGNATSGRYNWSRAGAPDNTDLYRRWDASKTGNSANQDFRNVANTFGWVVEIDPFNPNAAPKKRTAIGRFAHEGCWAAPAVAGQPLVFYSGDDARNEYIYKFVSNEAWNPRDARRGMAAGDKYLDSGVLYAAKFNDDGTGEWLPLTLSNPSIANYADYAFADEADVLINARLAADAVGATKMDRPEWGGVNPVNGDVYMTMTNSVSGSSGRGSKTPLDAANPRYYADEKNSRVSQGNVNGHIIRWREAGGNHTARTFNWDIYLFGAQADAGSDVNLSGLTNENDFSSPDGLWFSTAVPGLLWIQTDDGAYTDVTNCMMLAALPGAVGDGGAKMVTSKAVPSNGDADQTVRTYVGQSVTPMTLSRFLVGPRDCEITGITESPDGKTIFVNIQHPGENSDSVTDPAQFTSHWPDGGTARPRSATVVITRNDGGRIAI